MTRNGGKSEQYGQISIEANSVKSTLYVSLHTSLIKKPFTGNTGQTFVAPRAVHSDSCILSKLCRLSRRDLPLVVVP